jgi:hypothetical protein
VLKKLAEGKIANEKKSVFSNNHFLQQIRIADTVLGYTFDARLNLWRTLYE